jgi:hypothetical protein
VRQVAHVGDAKNVYKDLASKPHRKNHLEELGMDGMVTLKWILSKGITSITI